MLTQNRFSKYKYKEHKEKGTAKVCANSGEVVAINTRWSHEAVNGATVLTGNPTLGGFC